MGIHGTNKDRITDLENDLASLKRTLARSDTGANPYQGRDGKWLATLQGDLEHGGTANANLYWFDGANLVDTGQDVEVNDFFLGPEQAIPSGAKVEVEFFSDSRWYVTRHGPRPYFCTAKNDIVETGASGTVTFDNFVLIGPNPAAVAAGGFHFTGGAIVVENPGFYLLSLTISVAATGAVNGAHFSGAVTSTATHSVLATQGDYASGASSTEIETRSSSGIMQVTAANTAVNCTYTQPANSELTASMTFLGIDMDPLAVP